MTIYAEYLFIENFITTVLLLMLTARLIGYSVSKGRIAFGGVFGAISSLMIFVQMGPSISILTRVMTGTICVLITFGRRMLLKVTALFFVLTFCSGGLAMAFSLWVQSPSIFHYGVLYMATYSYLKILCLGVLAFGFTYWFVKFVREHNIGTRVSGSVCIVVDEKEYYFSAFVDSGNSLREPITDIPVILIDKVGAKKLHVSAKFFQKNFLVVPYRAVGVESGLLEGIKVDKVIFEKKALNGVCLAFYEGVFKDYEVLLNRDFLEGGLLE